MALFGYFRVFFDFISHIFHNFIDFSLHIIMAMLVFFFDELLGCFIGLIKVDENLLIDSFEVLMENLVLWGNQRTLIFLNDTIELLFDQNYAFFIHENLLFKFSPFLFLLLVHFLKIAYRFSGIRVSDLFKASWCIHILQVLQLPHCGRYFCVHIFIYQISYCENGLIISLNKLPHIQMIRCWWTHMNFLKVNSLSSYYLIIIWLNPIKNSNKYSIKIIQM